MNDEEFVLIYYKIVTITNKLHQYYNPKLDYEALENEIQKEVRKILEEIQTDAYDCGYNDGQDSWVKEHEL